MTAGELYLTIRREKVAITRKYQPLFLWSVLTFQLAFIHSLGRTSRHRVLPVALHVMLQRHIYFSSSALVPLLLYPTYFYTLSIEKYQYQPHQKLNAKTCFHTTTPHLHIRPDLHHPGNNKSVSSRSAQAWRIGKKQQQCQTTTTTTTTRYPLHHTPAQTHCTVPTAQKKKKKQSDPKSDSNPLPMDIISSP